MKTKSFFTFSFAVIFACILEVPALHAQSSGTSGTATYYDIELSQRRPVSGAQVTIETYFDGDVGTVYDTYTDANGFFNMSFPSGVNPNQIRARLFFRNDKIDLSGVFTTHSTFVGTIDLGTIGECSPGTPCDFRLPYFSGTDFYLDQGAANNDYARAFYLTNVAADFAASHGFTPPQCVVKFPAEESIVNDVHLSVSSFYFPFGTIPVGSQLLTVILPLVLEISPYAALGVELLALDPDYQGELTSSTVYLTHDVVNPGHRTTVFHEYGHFIMDAKRGWNWPYSIEEIETRHLQPSHSWTEIHQVDRVAFVEGWGNFYGSAVESWLSNPGSPYSGRYQESGNDYPILMENLAGSYLMITDPNNSNQRINLYDAIPNGYNHELLIGATFFDLYDPAAGDDNIQSSLPNILDVIGERWSVMGDYMYHFVRESFLSDQQRNQGIGMLTLNKMDPIVSYENATMYVQNDFHHGTVLIDNSSANTDESGGLISKTELWMSSKRVQAVEQVNPADNYQRVFKHTHPVTPLDTWTTTNQQKKNFTDLWQTYTDALTFTANFDKLCNITLGYQSLDGFLVPTPTASPIRERTPLSISPPTLTVGGLFIPWLRWSDGVTDNPRSLVVTQNQTFTGVYKAHVGSSNSNMTGSNNQRKVMRDPYGTFHLVYESGGEIWYSTSTDGSNWSNETMISDGSGGNFSPSLDCSTEGYTDHVRFVWVQSSLVRFKEWTYNYSTHQSGWSNIDYLFDPYRPSGNSASWSPVVSGGGWVVYNKSYGSSSGTIVAAIRDNTNAWRFTSVPSSDNLSKLPSMIVGGYYDCYVVYEQSSTGAIMYNKVHFDNVQNTFAWGTTTDISLASSRTANGSPSLTWASYSNGTLAAAWHGRNGASSRNEIIVRTNSSGIWSQTFSYFAPSLACTTPLDYYNPVIRDIGNGNVGLVWWENDNKLWAASSNGSSWNTYLVNGVSSQYPTLSNCSDGTTLKLFYTGITGPVYTIQNVNAPMQVFTPSAPALSSPANNATGVNAAWATLSWSCVFGAQGYNLQVSTNSAFSGTLFINTPVTGTSYTPSFAYSTQYYWRVNAVYGTNTSAWSYTPAWKFTTQAEPPPPPPCNCCQDGPSFVDEGGGTDASAPCRTASRGQEGLAAAYIPSSYALWQNYPNPFNPVTAVQYDLPEETFVSLKVYDALGRLVAVLVEGHQSAGRKSANFDASKLTSGMYFYRLHAGNYSAVKKMALAK